MMTVQTIGGDALKKKLDEVAGEKSAKVFKSLVDDTAFFIHEQAVNHIKKNVKQGTGHLIKSMRVDTSGIDFAIVRNDAEYAPYVEFGTAKRVIVPQEFSGIASQIRSRPTKSFKEGLQAIKDWCKRLGIPERSAYPIFMSILRTGVRPRPFLYPAYKMGVRYILKETKKVISKLVK